MFSMMHLCVVRGKVVESVRQCLVVGAVPKRN